MSETVRTPHPIYIGAAVAVILASGVVVASYAGLLPSRSAPEATVSAAPQAVPAPMEGVAAPVVPPPAATKAPAARHAVPFDPPPPPRSKGTASQAMSAPAAPAGDLRYASERSSTSYGSPANDAGIDVIPARPPAAPMCRECGVVESVTEVSKPAEASGIGAVAGGVVGGLLGNQVGHGKGNTAATIVGAVGGAFAGHQAEKYVRTDKQYQVAVRFEDGSTRRFTQADGSRWHAGDRVRLNNGALMPN